MAQVIGVMGLARAGKTTFAEQLSKWIVQETDMHPAVRSVAGPLKQGVSSMGVSKENHPKLYRHICQYIGELVRNPKTLPGATGPDWWLNLLREEVTYLTAHETNNNKEMVIIIDDIRYQNEVDFVRECNGKLVYIDPVNRVILDNPMYNHESEQLALEYLNGVHKDTMVDVSVRSRTVTDLYRMIQAHLGPVLVGQYLLPEDYDTSTD